MDKKKKSLQQVGLVSLVLLVMIILFCWYTGENRNRIEERNKNYAADSARVSAYRIDEELTSALNHINIYAYYLSQGLKTPEVDTQMLAQMQENALFDVMMYTDKDGVDHTADGRTSDASKRKYYRNGIVGKDGVSIIFDSPYFDEPMASFYAPVYFDGEIIGVLRGAFLAEEYLENMLSVTYFGEKAAVYLCMPDGRIIAGSSGELYGTRITEKLVEDKVIDPDTADKVQEVFDGGGEGAFICREDCLTDNVCVKYLPSSGYVLVQTFPKNVTQQMIRDENLVGIRLETGLIILFAVYIIVLLVSAGYERKRLERENQEMSYIIDGVTTLFSRFTLVDFEDDTYRYLAGTRPMDDRVAVSGPYEDLRVYFSSLLVDENERQKFLGQISKESIIIAMEKYSSLRFEVHSYAGTEQVWEHVNIICLERKNGKAAKVLFLRQDITEVKERELQNQAKLSIADRKERQYRIAVTASAICTFEFNLTQDLMEEDIVRTVNGQPVSLLKQVGMEAPCRASEVFERWKRFIAEESLQEYSDASDFSKLTERFENGEAEVTVEYWSKDVSENISDNDICVSQSFLMTRDYETGDILVMVVTKDVTEMVKKRLRETQALQDALVQAQHANKAKTTFLSNMSHDIRTPMNAIIGFATIAVGHIDNKEQVKDCLQKVLSSSNHLLSLINDILDMSRIESGKIQIKEQNCNLAEIMHNLINIIQPQVKAKQIKLDVDTYDVQNEDIIADPLKLNQVFINLLSNAVKYTPADGNISFRIIQKRSVNDGYGEYMFVVKDNGIGMSQEFVDHIFEPFERETTVTQSGIQGTGLGMAITKNIVEMMNGTINVESQRGKGSTFTVELSLKLQDVEETEKHIKEMKGLRALVVDDDFNICDSVGKMLKQIGMRSEWTTSGRDAVYRAKFASEEKDPYHTYIIDWQMPETNGVETARMIRNAVGPQAPVIIMTAYDWSDIEEEAKAAGVTAFCAKPLFMSNLKSALLAANDKEQEEETQAWTKEDFGGKRILLVEDIEMNREIAEMILSEAGFVVESAPDGTDAVAMVRASAEHYYDIILMDIQMPTMNGYEATRTIRALPREDVNTIPIIAMTANALEEDKEEALKNGMNAHIAKPLDIDVFMSVLKQFLE